MNTTAKMTSQEKIEDVPEIEICKNTMTVLFPDGKIKKLESTDNDDEMYAESDDVGVFYYKNGSHPSWVQGQPPTYPFSEELEFVVKLI
jgi:hypothetical protein